MLLVLLSILIIVCVYFSSYFNRKAASRRSKNMSGLANGGTGVNDESDLMTEQSSTSDFTVNDETEEKERYDGSEINSLQQTLEYTEMEIEEPPSFFNSQYGGEVPSQITMKSYLKRATNLKNDDHSDEDDVFEKKSVRRGRGEDKSTNSDDQSSSSSTGTRTNRQPRKARKPRDVKPKHPLFNWQQKSENLADRKQTGGNQGSDVQRDAVHDSSNSSASVSTIIPNERRRRKILRHIKIGREKEDEEEITPVVEKTAHHKVLQIAGVNVKFPVQPYSSQIAVMSKLIQGCKKNEHCLLESPTGSGKTLALLCGVLAWQEHRKDELRKSIADAIENAKEQIEAELGAKVSPEGSTDQSSSRHAAKECNNPDEVINQPALRKVCRSTSPSAVPAAEKSDLSSEKFNEGPKSIAEANLKSKPPTVYYGSRTHKQIEQVVRELKKTAYAYKKMTILSSRDFTCIQNTKQNKTEACNKLLDPTTGIGCRFHNENTKSRISTNKALNRLGINGPWDIEDLVLAGREQSACPYFAARDLMLEAEIVFCPYNYLVDPNIRQSMQIQLEGQIVILDEAHNVEEMSREVASLSFREDKIKDTIEEVNSLCSKRKQDSQTYKTIKSYLTQFMQFLYAYQLNKVDKFSNTSSSDFWTGVEISELFNSNNLGQRYAIDFQTAAAAAIMDFNSAKEERSTKQNSDSLILLVISQNAKKFLEDLTLAIQMMTSEKFANDYRACIIESDVRDFSQASNDTRASHAPITTRLRTLQMLCMNPAVIFAPLANAARCVILASGTLSPISSFQSELGTIFQHKLDANHVVPRESVYIRGIPCGPTGVQLKANYANVSSWNFQDELGRLVLNVCRAVPHGVLCFFSSYSVMQKQIDRWKLNSCWEQLEEVKWVLQEPRGSSNLDPVMQEFREIIKSTTETPTNGITGALLLAVFRGKVAEGIDFSDNEARCVMAVGIPYAVRMDPSVDMKFNYNNLNQAKGLLKGGEWYAVQAFRALNQALGRCVRHRNDWGAVLLVDQRFLEKTNYNYLPKWVKTMWRDSVRYDLTRELQQFVAHQIERTNKEMPDSTGS